MAACAESSAKCPRYLSVESTHDGLGDQLERLFAALSLAWRHRDSGITLAVAKDFGSEGKFTITTTIVF